MRTKGVRRIRHRRGAGTHWEEARYRRQRKAQEMMVFALTESALCINLGMQDWW